VLHIPANLITFKGGAETVLFRFYYVEKDFVYYLYDGNALGDQYHMENIIYGNQIVELVVVSQGYVSVRSREEVCTGSQMRYVLLFEM
ncbi:hypothetical protein J6590_006445, partial [Homalodisca vitripennis]